LNEIFGFPEWKNPSPDLLRRAPSPQGRGLPFLVRVKVGKSALSRGERVDRDGAFASRRGPGEGLVAGRGWIRQARPKLLHGNEQCVEFPESAPKDLRSSLRVNCAKDLGSPQEESTGRRCKETAGMLRPPKNGVLSMTGEQAVAPPLTCVSGSSMLQGPGGALSGFGTCPLSSVGGHGASRRQHRPPGLNMRGPVVTGSEAYR
jgi:hypothetical protein